MASDEQIVNPHAASKDAPGSPVFCRQICQAGVRAAVAAASDSAKKENSRRKEFRRLNNLSSPHPDNGEDIILGKSGLSL
jgi:hypothetical protein